MVQLEDAVLTPLEPTQASSSDDWPEFALRNAVVLSQQDRTPVSLLTAHPTTPVTVEGVLSAVDRESSHLVKNSRLLKERIRIENVKVYSFSQWEDGTLGFWAAGRAGWFELRTPSRAYEPLYRGMTEAASMFYYLADKYRNARPRGVRETFRECERFVRRVMKDYVHSNNSTRRDAADAREGFHEHRRFLIRCMLEGQEGLDWESSPVLRYFKGTHADDYTEMQELVDAQESSTEANADKMEEDSPPEPVPKRVKMQTDVATPKKTKQHHESHMVESDDSRDDDFGSVPRTRSVLRPVGSRSSKKYIGRQVAKHRSANTTDADADVEDDTEQEFGDFDSPSRMAAAASNGDRDATFAASAGTGRDLGGVMMPVASYFENVGPGDIWTCPYDGCNHKVWDARAPASIEQMEDHFKRKHAESMKDLIMAEMRPYNRVGHLLSRVRDLAAMGSQIDDEQLEPDAVVRRY